MFYWRSAFTCRAIPRNLKISDVCYFLSLYDAAIKNVVESKPVVAGTTFVFVWYEKSKHRVFMDVGATVAAFEMHVYLATGVIPPRQKLVGFDGACRGRSCATLPVCIISS